MKILLFLKNWLIWFITPFWIIGLILFILWFILSFVTWNFEYTNTISFLYEGFINYGLAWRIIIILWAAICVGLTDALGHCRFYN